MMDSISELYVKHIAQVSDYLPLRLDIETAEGIHLIDTKGKKYIDFISGISVNNLGHRHPKIVDAIKKQLDRYLHVMVYGEYIQNPQVEYAKLLSDHLPKPLSTMFYVNSGSEAIEGAIKLAKLHTGRRGIAAFKNSYHGSTLGTLSLIDQQQFRQPFLPLLPDCTFLDFNKTESLELITENTACVIVEPIQAAPGHVEPQGDFLLKLKQKCRETGALLILDEIQTGFGRTGKLFAFEHYNIVPDVLCLAKGMGGGMPMAAFVSSEHIMDSLNNGHPLLGHATTFGGHPVCCASAKAALEIILDENLAAQALQKEQIFREKLAHPDIKEIRGKGLFLTLVLQNADQVKKIVEDCVKNGLIINWYLFDDCSINIGPPLTITTEEIDEALDILLSAIIKHQITNS